MRNLKKKITKNESEDDGIINSVEATEMCDTLVKFQFLDSLISDETLHLLVDDVLYVGNESKYNDLQVATLYCISSLAKRIPNLGCRLCKTNEEVHEFIVSLNSRNRHVQIAAASAFQWMLYQTKIEGILRHKFIESNLFQIALNAVFSKRIDKKDLALNPVVYPYQKWKVKNSEDIDKFFTHISFVIMELSQSSLSLKYIRSEELEKLVSLLYLSKGAAVRHTCIALMNIALKHGSLISNEKASFCFNQLISVGLVSVLLRQCERCLDSNTLQHLLGTLYLYLVSENAQRLAIEENGHEYLSAMIISGAAFSYTGIELTIRCLHRMTVSQNWMCARYIQDMDSSKVSSNYAELKRKIKQLEVSYEVDECTDDVTIFHENAFVFLLQMCSPKFSQLTRSCAIGIICKGDELIPDLLKDLAGEDATVRILISFLREFLHDHNLALLAKKSCQNLNIVTLKSNKSKRKRIFEQGGLDVLMQIVQVHDHDDVVYEALIVVANLCFVDELQEIIASTYLYDLIKKNWQSSNPSISALISKTLRLCKNNAKTCSHFYKAELYIKSMDHQKLTNYVPSQPSKKIMSFKERNGLVRKNFDFNFSLSLRKPNLKSEINLSGESGAAKLRFIEWLNRTEEDEKSMSDNPELFSLPARRSLVTRGLHATHIETADKRLGRQGLDLRGSKNGLQLHPRKPKNDRVESLQQTMRKSMQKIWQYPMPSTVSNDQTNSTASLKVNGSSRWTTKVESLRPGTPASAQSNVSRDSRDYLDEGSGPSIKLLLSPAISPRSNYKFAPKVDLFAPVEVVVNQIERNKRFLRHGKSPLKNRKVYAIPRVKGSKIYENVGNEVLMPDGKRAIIYDGNEKELEGTDPNKFSNDKLNIAEDIIKTPLPLGPPLQELTQEYPSLTSSRPYYKDLPKSIQFPAKSDFVKLKGK